MHEKDSKEEANKKNPKATNKNKIAQNSFIHSTRLLGHRHGLNLCLQ